MSEYNIRLEDDDNNIYYPETKTELIKTSSGKNLEKVLNELFQSGNNVKEKTVDALLQVDNSLQINKNSNWTNIINTIIKINKKGVILSKDICEDNYILTKRIYLDRTTRQDFNYNQNFKSYFNTTANTLFLEIAQSKYKYVLNKDKQVILGTTSGLLDNVILLDDGTVLSYSNHLFKKFSENGKEIWNVDLKKYTNKDEYFKFSKIKDNYYIEETNYDRYVGLNLTTGEVSSNQQMKDIYWKAFQNEDYFLDNNNNANGTRVYKYKNNYFSADNDGNVARHETIWSGSKTVWNVKINSRGISIIGFKDNLIVVSRKPKNGFKNSLLFYNVATGEKVQEIELPEEEDALFMSEDGTLLTSHKIYPEDYIIFYLYKDKIILK